MSHFMLRLLAGVLLAIGVLSFSGCKFMPGGSYWQDNHQDYYNHDPTQHGT